MNNYFLEQINNCIDEFYKLYNIDEYISKSRYEKFIDKYKDIFNLLNKYENKNEDIYQKMISIAQNGYKMIETKNEIFLQRHLVSDKEYFDKILLLGRFNSELDNLLDSNYFYKKTKLDDSVFCKSHPDMKIDFLSIHKSKGVGYDQVIILNGLNIYKGFPSQIKDHPVIKLIKNVASNVEENYIEYPEERRLFYVALTRTKNKVYILIPELYEIRSDFIKEIENKNNVIVSNI